MTISRRAFLRTAADAAGLAATGGVRSLARAATPKVSLPSPNASGIEHIVVLCMENRSFDHFLGWVPGADGRQEGLTYADTDEVLHSTHHLQDWQGCGFADPNHSHRGGVIQLNGGRMGGFRRGGNDDYALGYYTKDDLPTIAKFIVQASAIADLDTIFDFVRPQLIAAGKDVERYRFFVLAVFVLVAVGFFFVRLRGVGPELVWWENLKARLQPKPKFKVVPKPTPARRDDDDISESVDPILDKIARSGIGSLTPNERRILDRARDRLLKESK